MLSRSAATISLVSLLALVAHAQQVPPAVNGWREYPLRDGVISIQRATWRTDTVRVPVPAGKGLEYKLTMKKGEGLVYNISYGTLSDPRLMLTEFHGHTAQVNGVGDSTPRPAARRRAGCLPRPGTASTAGT